jgi:hypothetical protein
MGRVLSMTLNDTAARALGVTGGPGALAPGGGLAPGLRERIAGGIARRGHVLTWADSAGDAAGAPGLLPDLTAWECADSSFHLEDLVPVEVALVDDAPLIDEAAQGVLLRHGIAFALEFSALVHGLGDPAPVRCVVGVNETNATFRFHRIRPGESWHHPDLDGYARDKMFVMDICPAPGRP